MDLKNLCMYCMNGRIGTGGICSACGKPQLAEQVPSCALPLETIVHGRYLVGGVLGQGGFGITYVAYDLSENRRVVLKELYPSFMVRRKPGTYTVSVYKNLSSFEKNRDRFIKEAQLIYTFRATPEIVDVYHIFTENNTGYYVMEYLNGQTLQSFLKRNGGRMSWNQLNPIVHDVIRALRVVHQSGSIHRDISPDNIFLLSTGKAKLIDFGAARHFDTGKALTEIIKKGFAPWEQYQANGKQGPWTDIYAFAATIYLCLTGVLPPEASARVMQDTLKTPAVLGVSLPSTVEYALMKALSVRADARFASIDEFAKALGFTCEQPAPAISMPSVSQARPASRWFLRGVRGQYAGVQIPLTTNVIIGRDPRRCTLVYPSNAPGISAVQMTVLIAADASAPGVRCESTSQAIYINGVMFCGRGRIATLQSGDRISFGNNQIFTVERVRS